MANEGQLYKGSLGSDTAHTENHPPVILNGVLKAGHGGVAVGTVLSMNAAGEIEKSSAAIIGVCEIAVDEEQRTVSYVAHGTVKASLLKDADGLAFTDFAALAKISIYAI